MFPMKPMRCLHPWILLVASHVVSPVWGQAPIVEIKRDNPPLALAWSADGKRLVSGWTDGLIQVREIPSGKELLKLSTGVPISGVVFSADGKLLGVKSGAKDGPLMVWDLATQKKLRQLAFPGYYCNQLAFTPDGQTLVAGGPGEHMVWNHVKGGGYGSRSGKIPEDSSAAVTADGRTTAWCNPQGNVQFFHTDQRKHQRMQIGPALAFAFTPDARFLVAASPDKSLRLWAVQGGEVRKFEGLRDPARLLHISANGKVLAAASPGDPVVRLWDLGSGRLRRRLTTQPTAGRALALSPDGLSLALASGNRVDVWNVATRELGDLGPAKALSEVELKTAWDNLASTDHAKSEAAFRDLARARDHALPFLKGQVSAIAMPVVDFKRVEQLLKELDNISFPVRQRAFGELAKHGEFIQGYLEKYLAAKPSLEGERRARKLLDRLRDPELTPERLRCLETIEILEIWQTAQARGVLEEIARGGLIGQIRLAARDALLRVNRPEAKDTKNDAGPNSKS